VACRSSAFHSVLSDRFSACFLSARTTTDLRSASGPPSCCLRWCWASLVADLGWAAWDSLEVPFYSLLLYSWLSSFFSSLRLLQCRFLL
jgi:hypothetical protein